MKEHFDLILKSSGLKDITVDIIEKALDSQITSDILKEIPIVKTLVGLRNIHVTYTDRLFIKKAMFVLLELGDINWKQRIELTHELDDEDSSGTEKILMAIDRLETIKKCKVFGRLCKLKALNRIDADEFSRLTKLIQDAYFDDLELVPHFAFKINDKRMKIYEEEFYPLISLGLIYQEQSEQTPIERLHQYNESDPEFKGGEVKFTYRFSMLGNLIMSVYQDLFPE